MRIAVVYPLLPTILLWSSLVLIQHSCLSAAVDADDLDDDVDPHPFLNKVQPFGFQSTFSKGNDFAASIIKSPRTDNENYFATGTTSGMLVHAGAADRDDDTKFFAGMHCYVVQMKPFEESWSWTKKIGAFRNSRQTPTATTCTSVRTLPLAPGDDDDDGGVSPTLLVVLGYTEGDVLFNPDEGDFKFSEIAKAEASLNKINGFVMLLSLPAAEEAKKKADPSKIRVVSGRMLHEEKVTYPISVTVVGENDFVVVSMVTDETGVNMEAALRDSVGEIGDFEPVFRYGQFYQVKVERLSYDPSDNLVRRLWSQIYEADDGLGAQVTSIIYDELEERVTVAGTTHGQGEAFGRSQAGASSGSDLDGFYFSLDVNTGKLDQLMTKRVQTVPGRDEFIEGMCKKKNGEALYLVGSTNAIIENGFEPAFDMEIGSRKFNAFIRKINLDSMETIWTRQIGPVNLRNDPLLDNQDVMGMGCAVDEEKAQVYVSGTVANGASVVPGQFPTGQQDIFIAGFQSTSGRPLDTFPIRQLGSVMDEYVAKDGGGITTDKYGNAVLFGTTKGNFIQEKPAPLTQFQVPFADIYFMSFLVDDSEHVETIETATIKGITSTANYRYPYETPSSTIPKGTDPVQVTMISIFVIITILCVFVVAYKYGKRQAATQIEDQTDQDIARYLEEFEGGDAIEPNTTEMSNMTDNQMYDISSYYGSSFAMGKDTPSELKGPPNMVNLPTSSVEEVVSGNNSEATAGSNSYDELMESYKSIMSATSSKGDNDGEENMLL